MFMQEQKNVTESLAETVNLTLKGIIKYEKCVPNNRKCKF